MWRRCRWADEDRRAQRLRCGRETQVELSWTDVVLTNERWLSVLAKLAKRANWSMVTEPRRLVTITPSGSRSDSRPAEDDELACAGTRDGDGSRRFSCRRSSICCTSCAHMHATQTCTSISENDFKCRWSRWQAAGGRSKRAGAGVATTTTTIEPARTCDARMRRARRCEEDSERGVRSITASVPSR
jgi:hypothetical protein